MTVKLFCKQQDACAEEYVQINKHRYNMICVFIIRTVWADMHDSLISRPSLMRGWETKKKLAKRSQTNSCQLI